MAETNLSGRRVAVLAENDYEDLEAWYPLLRLQEAGAEVVVVGPQAKEYTSKHGYPIKVDRAAENVAASDVDGVVVPGGWAPDRLRRYPSVLKLVRDLNAAGKPVAAICHAGWVLASANVVRGRKVTSVPAIKDDLINAGANWVDEEVVVDGNLVTSRTPADLPAFCRALIQTLAEAKEPVKAGR